MCTKPAAVFIWRRKSDTKWSTKYYANTTHEEAIHSMLDFDVIQAEQNGLIARWSTVPCGQCFECRLQRSREWANRCMIEMSDFKPLEGINRNWFVTLSYDPSHTDHLRSSVDHVSLSLHNPNAERNRLKRLQAAYAQTNERRRAMNECFGDLPKHRDLEDLVLDLEIPKEVKDDLSMFMVQLRKYYDRKYLWDGIRFFACGEYGDENMRPHYHLILFNCPIDPLDLKYFFTNEFGHKFYQCDLLADRWKKGFVTVSEANWTNAAYTARYIMKKQTGDAATFAYDDLGILAPFTRMSRDPGIGYVGFKGYDSYVSNPDSCLFIDPDTGEVIHNVEHFKTAIVLPDVPRLMDNKCKQPRYYDKLMEKIDPALMDLVKQHREKVAEVAYNTRKALTAQSDRELFACKEADHAKDQKGEYRKFLKDLA